VDGLSRHQKYAIWSSIRLEQGRLRLVPTMPPEYDVPTEPTRIRGPHRLLLLNT